MTLHFYIDKQHFPYKYGNDLSFDNQELSRAIGPDSWLCWSLQTYLKLRDCFECRLVDEIPSEGITLFFRGSISMNQKPTKKQFWVCMVGDSTWHPYSQVNLMQNTALLGKFPGSYFIRLWPQLNIKKSLRTSAGLRNIYFFGDLPNLAPELKSENWREFLAAHDIEFVIPPKERWNDYTDVDAIIAIRNFEDRSGFPYKPSTKLVNSWLANVVPICGVESAFQFERENELDYVEVRDYEQLKHEVIRLKKDPEQFGLYKRRAIENSHKYSDEFFIEKWRHLVNQVIFPQAQAWKKMNAMSHALFLRRRYFLVKYHALRIRAGLTKQS